MFISHDLKLVSKITDRLVILKDGAVVETGINKKIFKGPISDYTKALLSVIINPKKRLKTLPTIKTYESNKKLVKEDKSQRQKRQKKIYSNEPILRVNNVSKFYNVSSNLFQKNKQYQALNNINLKLY